MKKTKFIILTLCISILMPYMTGCQSDSEVSLPVTSQEIITSSDISDSSDQISELSTQASATLETSDEISESFESILNKKYESSLGPLLNESYYKLLNTKYYTYKYQSSDESFTAYVDGDNVKLSYNNKGMRYIILRCDGTTYVLNDIKKLYYKMKKGLRETGDSIMDPMIYNNLTFTSSRKDKRGEVECIVESYKTKMGDKIEFYFANNKLFLSDNGETAASISINTDDLPKDIFQIPASYHEIETPETSE